MAHLQIATAHVDADPLAYGEALLAYNFEYVIATIAVVFLAAIE